MVGYISQWPPSLPKSISADTLVIVESKLFVQMLSYNPCLIILKSNCWETILHGSLIFLHLLTSKALMAFFQECLYNKQAWKI